MKSDTAATFYVAPGKMARSSADYRCIYLNTANEELSQKYRLQLRGQALRAVTLSAGVAVFPDHADSTEVLVRAADQALYGAKAERRNRVLVSPSLTKAKI